MEGRSNNSYLHQGMMSIRDEVDVDSFRLRNTGEEEVLDVDSYAHDDEERVSLPRKELDALLGRMKVWEDTRKADNQRVRELEEMVTTLLLASQQQNGTIKEEEPPKEQPRQHPGAIELTELVDSSGAAAQEAAKAEADSSDDVEWHSPFGESIYTLFYLCAFQSQGFWYSALVYLLQMITITLALADALDLKADRNPLQIPAMVDPAVTYAQTVTIFLLFAYQSDVIEAVVKLSDGFYDMTTVGHPGTTFATWLFSCVAQMLAGLLVLLGCFLLTMQASTVVELMLNLTALLFISEIDDLGFYMAKMGFITNGLEKETKAAISIKIPMQQRRYYRRSLYFLTVLALMTGYGILKNWQLNGRYLFSNVYVQFGDAYNPTIPYYSGILTATNARTTKHRQYRDMGTSNILLAYCNAERAWTFSSEGNDNDNDNKVDDKDVADPCKNIFAISYTTDSYDVTIIPDSEWQVVDPNQRLQPFDSFSLVERDCHPKTCQGICGAHDGLCQCPHDQFGMDCEFSSVCDNLMIDERFSSFPEVLAPSYTTTNKDEEDPDNNNNNKLELTTFSQKYQLLQNPDQQYLRIQSMPVYYSNSTFPASIIFFGGRRWILTTEQEVLGLDFFAKAKIEHPHRWYFPEKTVQVLGNGNFHAHHEATYTPFLISDPVDFETPDFQPTPIGIHWWTVKNTDEALRHFTPDAPIDTVLICRNPTPQCHLVDQPESFCNFGDCVDGLCVCWEGYQGDRCDVVQPCYDSVRPCQGNGNCDPISGTCQCRTPWYGDSCTYYHKCYEEGGSCQNGGLCDERTGECSCPVDPAISGVACEKRAECAFFGCANGGICGWNGQCICLPPYSGVHCELVDKTQEEYFCHKDEDCNNGGTTCDLSTGFCNCNDPSSYGPLCEHTYNCSHSNVWTEQYHHACKNSGTCNHETGVCDCPEPYFGPDCSQLPPCLNDEDCGTGRCDVDSGVCQCPPATGKAAGLRCEIDEKELLCKSNEDCHGQSSTCLTYEQMCQCEFGLGGPRCESLTVGEYPPFYDKYQEMMEESVRLCGFEDSSCCFSNDTGIPEFKEIMCTWP